MKFKLKFDFAYCSDKFFSHHVKMVSHHFYSQI